ncbi:MAG: HEAT repeat domain-containing protein [Planctomycetes bacterium]|nr:HEAT repeat domain-containing protein [Planctomycetota bacterium]
MGPRKHRFSFDECMSVMRSKNDPQAAEDGFHALLSRAAEHCVELVAEFRRERNEGTRRWLLELIAAARSADAMPVLAENLRVADESLRFFAIRGLRDLGTKEARRLLWEARSFELESPSATASLREQLDRLLGPP